MIFKMMLIALITVPFSVSNAFSQDQPVLSIAPSYRDVGSADGSTNFTVSNTGSGTMNWTATESSDWVTLLNGTGTNTGTFTATYQDNFSTTPRTCTITVAAPGATGSPQTVTVNQAGAAPVLGVTPSNRSVTYNSGTTTFTVTNTGNGAMEWIAAETSDWVTLTSSSGINSGTVIAAYQANSSTTPRSCTITITASGATESPQTVTVYQAGTTPSLAVTPSNRSVSHTAGTTTFAVTNSGNGAMEWTATETGDWVTLTSSSGTNSGTITAEYQANDSTSPRSCTITITAPDASASPQTVTVYQAGTIPVLSVTPDTRNVNSDFGSTTFAVSNSGSGTLNWVAAESSDWVTLSDSTGTNSGTITANYQANDSKSPRSCTITITASDATGGPRSVTIYQAGTTPDLSVTPSSRSVSYTSGSTTFSVSNSGSGAMIWSASESSDWVTLSDDSGINSGTITANYQVNESTVSRTCIITVTASDATDSPQNITITQAGTAPVLSINPDNRDVSYTSGSTTFSVTNSGSGTMSWTASETSDWVTLSDDSGTNTGTITANYQSNDSPISRTCIITVSASDVTGGVQNITINQAGTKAVLSVTPANRDVGFDSDVATFTVSNTGSGVMNWIASGSNDWVTLSDSTGTNGGAITASFQTNNSPLPRSCVITIIASDAKSDATGSPKTITINQAGTKAVLSVTPANRDVGFDSDVTTFTVSNTGSGVMNWIASGSNDWVTLSDSTGTNGGAITASFQTNSSTLPRSCVITIIASDAASDATGSPQTITINQAGTKAVLSVSPGNRM